MIDIQQLMVDSHRIAKEHGFRTNVDNFPEKLCLIHSEISEALEEYRDKHSFDKIYTVGTNPKPEGIPVELADAIIRICEASESLGIPLEEAIQRKQAYNETRAFRHGKLI